MNIFAKTFILWFSICLLLTGCGASEDRKELLSYIKRIKSRTVKEIEPLPQVRPYETFTYAASDIRSPFLPPTPEQVITNQVANKNGIKPDQHRAKEVLESFPLDSLKMIGTLEQNKTTWAVLLDTEGAVHRVTTGNYIGQNHGKITKISEEKVYINEIIPDANGGWQKKPAEMVLVEQAEDK